MNRWCRRAAQVAFLLMALSMVLLPQHLAYADEPEVVKIRIVLNDGGFEGNPGDFIVEVEQGKVVEMTFVWDHLAYPEEEHIMLLDFGNNKKLEWDKIDYYNREASFQFVAEQSGTFNFKCDLKCEVHDSLQRGYLKVKPKGSGTGAGSGSGPVYIPTTLTIIPSSPLITGFETVSLMAVLKDAKEAPVAKADVEFYMEAEFAGTKGKITLGHIKTDANGVAFLDYKPTLAGEKHAITARFEGIGLYEESQGMTDIQVIGPRPSAYTMEPIGLERIRGAAPVALAIVILAIWATFGLVLFTAFRVALVRSRR